MHKEIDANIKNNSALLQRLNQIIPEIVDAFDPEEIILYGSYARGENTAYSEIDIIIIAETILRFQDRSLRALEIISDDEIPVNPFVYTPEEFQQMLEKKESYLLSALDESILIWRKNKSCDVQDQLANSQMESDYKKYL